MTFIIKNKDNDNCSYDIILYILLFVILILLVNYASGLFMVNEGFNSNIDNNTDQNIKIQNDVITNSVGDIVMNKDKSLDYNEILGSFSKITDTFKVSKPPSTVQPSTVQPSTIIPPSAATSPEEIRKSIQDTNNNMGSPTIPTISNPLIETKQEKIPKVREVKQEVVSAENIKPSLASLNAVSSEGLAGKGRVLEISNLNDVDNLMIGGNFKLRVNLPMMPPYIKGLDFDVKKGMDPNYFYLSVEKLMPNCSLSSPTNQCFNIYLDDKSKCGIKALTTYTSENSYRLVLVSAQYVFAPDSELGKNSDFTIVKFDGKLYLKNVQTGYMPNLYQNTKTYGIYGDINNDKNSNVGTTFDNIYNRQCTYDAKKDRFNPDPIKSANKDKTLRLEKPGCDYNPDKTIYLMTSNNLGDSTPVRITINPDKTISIKLLRYNHYGNATEVFQLSACNFNIKTFYGIEKVNTPLPIGAINVNVACYEKESNSKNRLNFTVELSKFPEDFMKKNSIFSLN